METKESKLWPFESDLCTEIRKETRLPKSAEFCCTISTGEKVFCTNKRRYYVTYNENGMITKIYSTKL